MSLSCRASLSFWTTLTRQVRCLSFNNTNNGGGLDWPVFIMMNIAAVKRPLPATIRLPAPPVLLMIYAGFWNWLWSSTFPASPLCSEGRLRRFFWVM